MKSTKITYWSTTAIIALMMTYSAYAYFTDPLIDKGFSHLGFPSYFRIELAIAILIGVVVLLAPLATRIKDWAYAGFAITFISAFIAHSASGDPLSARIGPVVFFALLVASYWSFSKLSARRTRLQEPEKVALSRTAA